MANNAETARARRELKRKGAKKLGAITVDDPKTWATFLREANVLHLWGDGEPTEEQLRHATEKLISEICRRERKAEADALLEAVSSKIPKIRTGAIEREPPPEPKEAPALNWRPSAGDHWSFRKGQQTDKGRIFTREELYQYLDEMEGQEDLEEEVTAAGAVQDIGVHVIGPDDE